MASQLQREIKQTKPFESLEQEAMLSLERTAAVLGHGLAEAMKPYGITPTQYNALRILRGAGGKGLCRQEVRERLVAQVPDVTRLLDRLEEMKLIQRERDAADRRLVNTTITRDGLRLLKDLDAPIVAFHRRQLGHVPSTDLRMLINLLANVRGGP